MTPPMRPTIRARINNNNTHNRVNSNQPTAYPTMITDAPPNPPLLPPGRILQIADGIDGDRERTFYTVFVDPPEVTPNWYVIIFLLLSSC